MQVNFMKPSRKRPAYPSEGLPETEWRYGWHIYRVYRRDGESHDFIIENHMPFHVTTPFVRAIDLAVSQ